MPMPPYPILCYRQGCEKPAVYKIAAQWSDGITRELKTEVNVPDVIGMTVQQATQVLQAAGFQAQVQSFGLGGGNNRRVWDYSPIGQAPGGSTILLDVLPGSGQGF